tara:strand:+ start:134 stop:1084 length:951 start_codon:yes stop_codon:yes gene_type:complete
MISKRRAFIVGLKSLTISKKEREFLKKYKPWGIIIFQRNIKSFSQIKNLTFEIKKIFKDNLYPILIDEEGGRVNRFNKLFNTSIFSGEYFGGLYKKDKKKFELYYSIYSKQISSILRSSGININTVPVLDLRRANSHNVIGDRSFGYISENVSKIGDYSINQFHKNKIGTVIKHIPGHGLATIDSHLQTPIVNESKSILLKKDFKVFMNKKSLFAMTAHIIYKKIDNTNTATHSKKIIKLIRNQLKFSNLIISDDISMKGLKYSIKENTKRAFSAGCNIVLHCNGNLKEMLIVAKNSPEINKFIITKTSQFYKIIT